MTDTIEVNLPFERIPQCACDPGTGPAPRNAEIFALRTVVQQMRSAMKEILTHDPAKEGHFSADCLMQCHAIARAALLVSTGDQK